MFDLLNRYNQEIKITLLLLKCDTEARQVAAQLPDLLTKDQHLSQLVD